MKVELSDEAKQQARKIHAWWRANRDAKGLFKEELAAAKEKAEKENTEEQNEARGSLPPGNFAALISMLTTQALFALGLLQIKGQEKKEPDLELAKYNIDMLETLEEKTKGNLTPEEQTVLTNTLNELRMGYVKIAG